MQPQTDLELVLKALEKFPGAGPRTLAAWLGWIAPTGRPHDWRVKFALVELLLDKRVEKVGGKWRVVKRS